MSALNRSIDSSRRGMVAARYSDEQRDNMAKERFDKPYSELDIHQKRSVTGKLAAEAIGHDGECCACTSYLLSHFKNHNLVFYGTI